MSDLIHNERTKLLATAINTGATSCFTVGVLAPIAAAIYTGKSTVVAPALAAAAAFVWILAATSLHILARRVLRGLRS